MWAEPDLDEPEIPPDPTPPPPPPAPASPPTLEEITAAIADHIMLDDGERALQRVATAERLGGMKLRVFDGLVTAARKKAPTHGGPRPISGRLPKAEQDPAETPKVVTVDDKSS